MNEPPALRARFDNPWRRVPAEAALAAALGLALLLGFLAVLGRAGRQPQEQRAIEAQLVVIPPAPKPEPIAKPVEPIHTVVKPVIRRPPVRYVQRPKPEPKATTPVEAPVDRAPAPPAARAEAAPPLPPVETHAPRAGSLGSDQMSARAILRPMPEIPDDLREHTLDAVAVVRFAVAADGSAGATLVQATPIPRLNQLLLEAFNRWRFFPALKDGKPVASVMELRVPVRIR